MVRSLNCRQFINIASSKAGAKIFFVEKLSCTKEVRGILQIKKAFCRLEAPTGSPFISEFSGARRLK
jgi:hypothetical protein